MGCFNHTLGILKLFHVIPRKKVQCVTLKASFPRPSHHLDLIGYSMQQQRRKVCYHCHMSDVNVYLGGQGAGTIVCFAHLLLLYKELQRFHFANICNSNTWTDAARKDLKYGTLFKDFSPPSVYPGHWRHSHDRWYQDSPSSFFAYFKRSKTEPWEGLEMRLWYCQDLPLGTLFLSL